MFFCATVSTSSLNLNSISPVYPLNIVQINACMFGSFPAFLSEDSASTKHTCLWKHQCVIGVGQVSIKYKMKRLHCKPFERILVRCPPPQKKNKKNRRRRRRRRKVYPTYDANDRSHSLAVISVAHFAADFSALHTTRSTPWTRPILMQTKFKHSEVNGSANPAPPPPPPPLATPTAVVVLALLSTVGKKNCSNLTFSLCSTHFCMFSSDCAAASVSPRTYVHAVITGLRTVVSINRAAFYRP